MNQNTENSNSMLIHLSALSNYIIPFGSILLPLILWQTTKKDSTYIDHHGKEAINFNLSFLVYNIVASLLLLFSIGGTVFTAIKAEELGDEIDIASFLFSTGGLLTAIVVLATIGIIKLILLIIASVKANQGILYRYPLSIRFIK